MGDTGGQPARVLDANNNIDPIWHDYIEESHLISQPSVSVTPSDTVITCTSPRFFGTTFTTAAVQQSFEIFQPISQRNDLLLLGLDGAGNNAIPTGDILSAFNVTSSDLPQLIGAIVSVLNSPIDNVLPKFQVDTSAGSKNGTWIIALDSQTLEVFLSSIVLSSDA